MSDIFLLSGESSSRQVPLLLSDTRGKQRADDLSVISGIVHVLKFGGRWVLALIIYGPREILFSRFVRGVTRWL